MPVTTRAQISREATYSDLVCREEVVVRRPSEADVAGVAGLFLEMQTHYGRPVSDAAAIRAAALACRQPMNTFDPHVLIASTGNTILGSIVMNVTFPAF